VRLTEYCDVLNVELSITYYPNQGGRWTASIKGAEIKRGAGLTSEYGSGATPVQALTNYVEIIREETLVLDAYTPKRREFGVPKSLEPA
jgi:hypothetical protein